MPCCTHCCLPPPPAGDQGWVLAQDDWPGQLLSFLKDGRARWRSVRAIPRITSQGVLCGAVYKVASMSDMGAGAGVH